MRFGLNRSMSPVSRGSSSKLSMSTSSKSSSRTIPVRTLQNEMILQKTPDLSLYNKCCFYLSNSKPQVLRTPGICCPLQKTLRGLVGSIQTTDGYCDDCVDADNHKLPFSTTWVHPRPSGHLLGGSTDPSAPGEGSTAGTDEHKSSVQEDETTTTKNYKICRSLYPNLSLSFRCGASHSPLYFDQGLGSSH